MLTENDVKEELSYAYVHAVASRAGFSCEVVRKDRDSIDLHLCGRGRLHPASTLMSPQLGLQVKARVLEQAPGATFELRLLRKNYDDLRQRSMIPRILVVFALPADPRVWLTLSEEALLLRRCAYWCSLLGAPDSVNEKYQTVHIDRKRLFHVKALEDLMARASREEAVIHGT